MLQLTQISGTVRPTAERGAPVSAALWWMAMMLSTIVASYGATYFFAMPGDIHFVRYIVPLRLHIAGGIGALLVGPWQFSKRLRTEEPRLHRWLGRFYLVEVAIGSIGGLMMATVSMEGLATHLGFGVLAAVWFATGLKAYLSIRRGKVEAHRAWMIRNFALSFAAVTLRGEGAVMMFMLHWAFDQRTSRSHGCAGYQI